MSKSGASIWTGIATSGEAVTSEREVARTEGGTEGYGLCCGRVISPLDVVTSVWSSLAKPFSQRELGELVSHFHPEDGKKE